MPLRHPRKALPLRAVTALVTASLATGFVATPASAQDSTNEDQADPAAEALSLDAVEVEDTRPALTVEDTEAARERIEKTPGAVEVVPAEDFRKKRAVTMKDMLEFVPGVFTQPQYGEESRLSIRGSGLSQNFHLRGVRLLQDGVPLNRPDGFGDFQEIDPLAFDRVEVLKGANALQFGATTLGGALNFVTPTGRSAEGVTARGEFGSFGFNRGQAQIGGVAGDLDYFVTGTFLEQNGFRDHSDSKSTRLNANFGYRLSPDIETRLHITYNNIDQELPGSLTRETALGDPDSAFAENVVDNFRRDINSVRLSNRTTVRLAGAGEVTVGGFYTTRDLHHPIFLVLDNETETFGGFARYNDTVEVAGHSTELVLGSNIQAGTTDDRRFLNLGGEKGALVDDLEEDALNVEVFAEARFFLRRDLALILGGQFAHNVRDTDDRLTEDGSDTSVRRTFNTFDPKFGVLWEPTAASQVFANVSRSTDVPTFIALNPTAQDEVPDVDEARATTLELGTRGTYGPIVWDAAVFHAWVKDEIQLFNRGQGRTFVQNAENTIHRGVELGFTAELLAPLGLTDELPGGLSLQNSYSFNDFRFDDDDTFGDNRLPGAPRHFLRAELLYEHPSGFFIGPNVEWVPTGVDVDNANTRKAPSYALLGARAGLDLPHGVSLFLDGRNLTDKTFIANTNVLPVATDDATIFDPGDGLAINGGVELRF
mgnify:CR=1 FL=1